MFLLVAQNVYNWMFYAVQSLTLILSQTMLWFGLKSVQYSGESRDFNTPMFKLICSIGALATQACIIHEFLNNQNSNSLNFSASFGLIKSKPKKTDISNKKRKNTGRLTETNNEKHNIIYLIFFFSFPKV